MNHNIVILRARKGVPGVGRKLSKYFDANEVTCGYRPAIQIRDNAVVINYGRSVSPVWYEEARARGVRLLNTPLAVQNSVDKIRTLKILEAEGIPCLTFTEDREVAQNWGTGVIVRHTTTGKQGKGVELFPVLSELPVAPLYTQHYEKTHEFRVHVVDGKVIDLVQKKRMGKEKRAKYGLDAADELIRNHKRGWVFAHNDLICDTGQGRDFITKLALDTVKALGLDYAGIDILAKYTDDGMFQDAVVCESNSAPGMSSAKTFTAYVTAFNALTKGE